MNCRECLDLLQRRLDGENLPGCVALDRHLAGCPSCRQTHAAGTLMLEGLRGTPRVPHLPADFSQRLVGSIMLDRHKRRQRMGRRVWVTVGLAAVILIAFWAGYAWQPPQPRPGQEIAVKKPLEPRPVPPTPERNKSVEENITPLAQSVDDARSDVLDLASRLAAEQTRLFAAFAPREIPGFPVEARLPMDEPFDPAAQSLRQAGQGVSEGLDTVSRNAQRAVSFFMNELPMLDPAN